MTIDPANTHPDSQRLIEELSHTLRKTTEEVVPWFLGKMPRRYLQDTDMATRLSHLTAILAARASAVPIRLMLKNADESEWTLIHDQDRPGLLVELLEQLPRNRQLRAVKVHTTEGVVLDVFRFSRPEGERPEDLFDPRDPAQARKRDEILLYVEKNGVRVTPVSGMLPLGDFLALCPADYVRTVTPFRLVESWAKCRSLFGCDDTVVRLEREDTPSTWRVSVAMGNARPNDMLERVATHLGHYQLNITRAYLDVFERAGSSVLLASFVVRPVDGVEFSPESALWRELERDLEHIKWLDGRALALAHRHRDLGLLRAELILALAHLVHPALARENSYAFTSERILGICERLLPLTRAITDLFLGSFDPARPLSSDDIAAGARALTTRIEREVDGRDSRRVLMQLVRAVEATLVTNVHVRGRYGLCMRFDPARLGQPQAADAPYGAFFVHGRGFNGYHVRFRDIARGGLRVVRTSGPEQHTLESERLYNEVYDLAFAQQLKNKDIPEGGAKAVVLAEPGASVDRCVKSFTNSLLDLLTPDPLVTAEIANRTGLRERIYLGPDENISPRLIEWIVERANRRGYPTPNAFMSSKPGAGINHKEYGVTSEGVTVFLEEALHEVGIDPRRQPFTIKITGGPDGDVAGNEIRILNREFGDNARIVGIADGSGCAEDPRGLDHDELLRLFRAQLPIAHFDRGKLGPQGILSTVDEDGGIKRRNSMHNRVVADAFVPAGGRPETIHENNWRDYLVPDGRPSSRVIVEGANLFITPDARHHLAAAGLVIVKDSSANKCGVICSSFEVVASMLLSSEEFLAVKERFVGEVIMRLRALARAEAQLLFRERRQNPGVDLPELSVRLSRVIMHATDAIEAALPAWGPEERALLGTLIAEHLPAVLLERAGDRLGERMPPAYWSGMVAATLATKIVYREGLSYLASMRSEDVAALAIAYLRKEQETAALVAEVAASSLPDRELIAAILKLAGARAGLMLRA